MNATAILEKLQEEAKENAAAILQDANDRAEKMRTASDAKIASAKADMEKKAKADGLVEEQRLIRMEELDERKRVLAAKRSLIDRAFDAALQKMKAMPADEARAFLIRLIAEVAEGDEQVIIGAEDAAWFNDAFVSEANAALKKAGRKGELTLATEQRKGVTLKKAGREEEVTLAAERRKGVSGLILAKDDTEINCSYAAILDSKRLEMEAEVAQVLFS